MKINYSLLSISSILSLSLLLSGCGIFGKKDKTLKPKPLTPFTATANAQLLWQSNTGQYAKKNYVKIHPVVAENSIYIAGGSSASAWDKQTGQKRWKTPVADTVTAGVNVGEGMIFVGTTGGNAIALDQATGKPRWVQALSSEILAVSPASNGMVVFRSNDGKVHGLSTRTGEVLWQQSRKTPILSLRGSSTPIVTGNKVIVGFDNGKLTAFDLQAGHAIWEAILAVPRGRTELDRIVDIDGKLSLVGTTLYAATYNGQIAAIDVNSGGVRWSHGYSTDTGVEADSSSLYTVNAKGDVFKLAAQNGSPIWKMDDLNRRLPTAPTIIGSHIMVGDQQGYLHFINRATGKFASRLHADKHGYSVAAVVDGNTVYTLGKSGVLSAMQLK